MPIRFPRRDSRSLEFPRTMDNDVRGPSTASGSATAIIARGVHQPAADAPGVARGRRRVPDLRPGLRIHRARTAMAISDIRCVIPEHASSFDLSANIVARDHAGSPGITRWSSARRARCGRGARRSSRPAGPFGTGTSRTSGAALGRRDHARDGPADAGAGPRLRPAERGSEPFDKIIANTFRRPGRRAHRPGRTGRMVCIEKGLYAETDLPDPRAPRGQWTSPPTTTRRASVRGSANRFGRTIFL